MSRTTLCADHRSQIWLRGPLMVLIPLAQQPTAFMKMMLPLPEPVTPLVASTVRSSTPEFLMFELPHQAPGLCEDRQFGIESPGEMVTVFPLMAATFTIWDCERPLRPKSLPGL